MPPLCSALHMTCAEFCMKLIYTEIPSRHPHATADPDDNDGLSSLSDGDEVLLEGLEDFEPTFDYM